MSAKQTSIILIGMPASGKSTLGRRLAGLTGRRFVDTDDLLRAQSGFGPSELNARLDFRSFVEREEETVLSLRGEGLVVATGGSVVYGRRGMQHLRALGTVVYLADSLKRIRLRVGGLKERGVLLKPGQSFAELYRERGRLYRRYADIIYENRRFRPAQSARILAALLRFIEGEG